MKFIYVETYDRRMVLVPTDKILYIAEPSETSLSREDMLTKEQTKTVLVLNNEYTTAIYLRNSIAEVGEVLAADNSE